MKEERGNRTRVFLQPHRFDSHPLLRPRPLPSLGKGVEVVRSWSGEGVGEHLTIYYKYSEYLCVTRLIPRPQSEARRRAKW